MRHVRFRVALTVALAACVMLGVWAWETRAWGAAYRPWNAAAAQLVDETMQGALTDNEMKRMGAQQVLASAGPAVTRPLLPYLTHEDFRARRLAATVLGYVGDWSVVDPLVARLDDSYPGVRKAAVLSLHRIAVLESAKALRSHAHDPDAPTRAAIAVALGDIQDAVNLSVLLELSRDEHGVVRQMAIVSLGRLGDADAVPALAACLGDPTRRTRLAAQRSLSLCTGLPAHNDANLWLAWWAVNHRS